MFKDSICTYRWLDLCFLRQFDTSIHRVTELKKYERSLLSKVDLPKATTN